MNDEPVPPSRAALREALTLSDEILRNIELGEIPLVRIALKVSRLARLLNDVEYQQIMAYEASGYPSTPMGVEPLVYQLAVLGGREYEKKDETTGVVSKYIFCTPIEELEYDVASAGSALAAVRDPDVSVASANPHQFVKVPHGNFMERSRIRGNADNALRRLASRRALIYEYTLRRNHELKFSGIADDIFSRIREGVDSLVGTRIPDAAQKLTAVYENLQSENPENWANAVHSCRRILQDLADALYPPRADVVKDVGGGRTKTIKLGADNYINRLIAYLEEKSSSDRFTELTGSHLSFIGDRLDSVFHAAQKGSHANVSKQEADRYVVYTYLVTGDILSL